ncbi:MAG TPA: beta-ketoacyl-ACP synthase III [Hyphomicrobium sp.]|nr:beta-ketoacyl-ACP synthase III [Hyphomicrobium sp.]
MSPGIEIIGFGHAAPSKRVTSAEIEARLGLQPGWIAKRTGIEARRYASDDEALSDIAIEAAEKALGQAQIARGDVSLLLLATSTPDHLLPPTAPLIAQRLGLSNAGAIDMAGACAGFVYALTLGAGFSAANQAPVAVIAGNILSRRINDDDRNTSSLFGDAAGAVIIAPSSRPTSGIIGSDLTSDGSAYRMIQIPGGGSRKPFKSLAHVKDTLMVLDDGKAVFSRAVAMMTASAERAMARAGIGISDVDHFIPHQANTRMMRAVADKLGIGVEKMRSTISEYGNSSAATIPFTLSASQINHPIARGEIVLMTAAGAGLTGGAVVLRW